MASHTNDLPEGIIKLLAETIRDVFWLYDLRERRLLYVSPAFARIWGRNPDWILEQPSQWLEAVHQDDRSRAAAMDLPLEPGEMFDEVYRIHRPDGTVRWIRDRRYAMADAAGSGHRIAGVAEDITERHEAAEQLSTVSERIASVSHEINQPLHVIANYNSAMGAALQAPDQLPVEKLRRWNEEIATAVRRAADIIRRMR
jgi:two-component system sensor kinase FixL